MSTKTKWQEVPATRTGATERYLFLTQIAALGNCIALEKNEDAWVVDYGTLVEDHKIQAQTLKEAQRKALAIVDTAITGMISKPWAEIAKANHITQTRYVGYEVKIRRGCITITTERKWKRIEYDAPYWHFFQHEQAQGAITSFDAESHTVTLHAETAATEEVKRTLWMPKYFELSFAEDAVEGYFRTHIRKE